MSDSYDDYEAKMQLAEHEWEMVKTEHDNQIKIAQAYERGWNAALAQQEPVYAFRRKGLDDFCTCDKRRYDELSGKPNLFEVTVFYTAPPKKQWVGLTLNEAEDFYEKYTDRAELINAIDKFLEEKNT